MCPNRFSRLTIIKNDQSRVFEIIISKFITGQFNEGLLKTLQ